MGSPIEVVRVRGALSSFGRAMVSKKGGNDVPPSFRMDDITISNQGGVHDAKSG
jgi:hypothetical protein